MKVIKKIIVSFLIGLIFLMPSNVWALENDNTSKPSTKIDLSEEKLREIDKFIEKRMDYYDIPGMTLTIVQGDKVIIDKGYGFANSKTKEPVTSNTLFELGSTSKAFTALGVLTLSDQGKVNLNDNVSKYLPWFEVTYKNEKVDITLNQLLHQNSGIPDQALGKIVPSNEDDALENSVRAFSGQKLNFLPGSRYEYSTVNYDVLGLIIQKVSGQQFEEYMKNNVLKPLDLNNTYANRDEVPLNEMAQGYKYGFLKARQYDSPIYRGNVPAGYFITCSSDLAKWLKIQLGTENISSFNNDLIKESHIPNRTVAPGPLATSYAMGWHVYQYGSGELKHSGANVSFASQIIFRPEDKIGIAVMSNIYSYGVYNISDDVMNMIMGRDLIRPTTESKSEIDNVFTGVFSIGFPFAIVIFANLCITIAQIFKGQRKFKGFHLRSAIKLLLTLLFVTGFTYCLYKAPDTIGAFRKMPWSYITVWGPGSLVPAIISIYTAGILLYLYILVSHFFPKSNEKSFFLLIVFGILSGFGNAFIIFIINMAIAQYGSYVYSGGSYEFPTLMFSYFIAGIVFYVYGQKLIRTRLVALVNNQVFNMRAELIDKLLKTSFYKFEKIKSGKIQASLNNDTEIISRFSSILVTGTTSLVTLIFCFIYLAFMSFYGFLISLVAIVIAAGLYFIVGKSARKLWEQTRDIQNLFFKFIDDLISGFKELSLSEEKRNDFQIDMVNTCDTYRVKRTDGDLKFANVFIIGELLFTIVIGSVAFVFPMTFKGIEVGIISNFVFVFLYMNGPLNAILNAFPELVQAKICWRRINEISDQISLMEEDTEVDVIESKLENNFSLEIKDIEYHYDSEDDSSFKVGPLNYKFNSGEIIFITGGNGSGKSTFAKLITGLYKPNKGEILLGGKSINSKDLKQYYSAIFSDFHLFEKLYGIDFEKHTDDIDKYLNILQIDNKVSVDNGIFSTINLSTGQKKRLAMLVSYIEDRPICLFDEWAADQDPEFRKIFYNVLLPEFRAKGKCVIAITHDDNYFHVADKFIKMEMGKIVETTYV